MHFESYQAYHVYNRGNEKQQVFFSREHYLFFLKKIRKEWLPWCKILSYCLMPNHFHFILFPNDNGCKHITLNGKETHMQNLSKTIGKTLSSYTWAINKENQRTGVLFQKKTKAKQLNIQKCSMPDNNIDYLSTCIHYIHNNPVKAQLVFNSYDWEFSSFRDYAGLRMGTLCDKELFYRVSGMRERDFISHEQSGRLERPD